MSKKAQKNGRNHKKTGKKRAILPKRPFKTGMPVLKRATSSHWQWAPHGGARRLRHHQPRIAAPPPSPLPAGAPTPG